MFLQFEVRQSASPNNHFLVATWVSLKYKLNSALFPCSVFIRSLNVNLSLKPDSFIMVFCLSLWTLQFRTKCLGLCLIIIILLLLLLLLALRHLQSKTTTSTYISLDLYRISKCMLEWIDTLTIQSVFSSFLSQFDAIPRIGKGICSFKAYSCNNL
jgi:hypothetical protein